MCRRVPLLTGRLVLQTHLHVVEALPGRSQILRADRLGFEGVAAVVAGRFSLCSLRDLREDLQKAVALGWKGRKVNSAL